MLWWDDWVAIGASLVDCAYFATLWMRVSINGVFHYASWKAVTDMTME